MNIKLNGNLDKLPPDKHMNFFKEMLPKAKRFTMKRFNHNGMDSWWLQAFDSKGIFLAEIPAKSGIDSIEFHPE